jgi:3-oxoacyl-[acyl-carrier protein] reductase
VAVNYIHSQDRAEAVAEKIRAGGGEAKSVGADVGSDEAVAGLFQEVESSLGPVEILVNSAGITRDGLLLRMKVTDWDDVLATNLRSVFLCTKVALRPMVKARWGRVISVTSVAGISGNAGQANYSAAKAGIIGFTKAVAKEVGSRGITVNAVAPGFIETDMTAELDDATRAEVKRRVSVGRFGTPQEIASAVGYLAGEQAGYVNGQVIVVDGGLAI